jgi:diguanylate cyclase (GGDEF)-like protein/PAS domain S-box-containing protein
MNHDCEFYQKILDSIHDGVYFMDQDRIITYWNRGAETLTGYKSVEVVGSRCHDNVVMHVDRHGKSLCTESCPDLATLTDGKTREMSVFLRHKEGHRLPVLIRVAPVTGENGQIVGIVETFSDNSQMLAHSDKIEALQKMAMLDTLTELSNRRYAEMKLSTIPDEIKNYARTFGLLFIDVDLFKEVNDTYGHLVGDMVLKMVSRTMFNRLRADDTLSRWGGDEFLAIITNVDEEQLRSIANDLRTLVEQSSLVHEGHVIRVTVSIGATLVKPEDTMDSLLKRGDSLNYDCKAAGRNCLFLG